MCSMKQTTWWRHQMETFSALLTLCEGNPPVTGVFPSHRPRSFNVFFDMRLNTGRRWFETPSRSIWRHCNRRGAQGGDSWMFNRTFISRKYVLMVHIYIHRCVVKYSACHYFMKACSSIKHEITPIYKYARRIHSQRIVREKCSTAFHVTRKWSHITWKLTVIDRDLQYVINMSQSFTSWHYTRSCADCLWAA